MVSAYLSRRAAICSVHHGTFQRNGPLIVTDDTSQPKTTTRWVAFLRGLNVGSAHRVTNDELVSMLTDAGLAKAQPFLASGNVVFDAETGRTEAQLSELVAETLESGLGYAVPAFIRSATDVIALNDANPFTKEELDSDGKPQVTLLAAEPGKQAWSAALALESSEDLIRKGDRAWFWLPHDGVSLSKVDMKAIERALGVGTMRTFNTVARITKKFLT